MSIAEKYRPHYTYDDYRLWEGKWELIGGIPYAMSPAPNKRHQWIASRLTILFGNALFDCKQCKIYQPIDWKITEDTVVQPDLTIVCKPFNNINFLDFPPSLVVEILSTSTAQKDRREKFELYESQEVKYYLIIDPSFKKAEVFELVNKKYKAATINHSSFIFSIDDDCKADILL